MCLKSAFLNFNSLLPSNLEVGIRIYLTTPEKYFTTEKAADKPSFKILDAKLLVEFILLKPVLLQAMCPKDLSPRPTAKFPWYSGRRR